MLFCAEEPSRLSLRALNPGRGLTLQEDGVTLNPFRFAPRLLVLEKGIPMKTSSNRASLVENFFLLNFLLGATGLHTINVFGQVTRVLSGRDLSCGRWWDLERP